MNETTMRPRPPVAPPRRGHRKRPIINATITRELDGIIYDCMVKTSLSQVYAKGDVTLVEILSDIGDILTATKFDIEKLDHRIVKILEGAPKTMNTFKEVWDYINVTGDPKSELIKLIESKEDHVEGKGLSTHDLTDILYEKLTNDYTKEELDAKFQIITDELHKAIIVLDRRIDGIDNRVTDLEEQNNMYLTRDPDEIPPRVKAGDIYGVIIREE